MEFLFLYTLFTVFFILVLNGMGYDFLTSFATVAACINNMGLGFGATASSFGVLNDIAKCLMCIAMILGRLEIYPVIILFSGFFGAPNIWLIYNCEFNIMLTHSLIQYLTLPATPPSPVALAAGCVLFIKQGCMSEKLKIVYRPLQELSPYAHNAGTHSTEQVAQLVESIKQFGWTNPVLIDEKGEIIAGHGRVMAAEMLKMDSVPVIVLSGLTDEQKQR